MPQNQPKSHIKIKKKPKEKNLILCARAGQSDGVPVCVSAFQRILINNKAGGGKEREREMVGGPEQSRAKR